MWIFSAPESSPYSVFSSFHPYLVPCQSVQKVLQLLETLLVIKHTDQISLTSWISQHCLAFLSLPAFCNHGHHSLSYLAPTVLRPSWKFGALQTQSCLLAFALGILSALNVLPKITLAAHSHTSFRFKGPERPSLPAFLQTFPPSALEGERLHRSKDSVCYEHGVQWCHSVRRQKLLVKPDKFLSDWPFGSRPFQHIAFS